MCTYRNRGPFAAVGLNRTALIAVVFLNLATVAAAQSLSVVETERTITVSRNGQTVTTYNKVSPPAPKGVDTVYERSGCLHPVRSPKGRAVTAMFPRDHLHQHGVFSAWVNTTYDGKATNFWDLAGRTGRVHHERVVSTFQTAKATGFEVDLIHRALAEPPVDVLRERWKISVYPTDGTYHCFDLETTQQAITDKPLVVNKYHYGGVALRGPGRWVIGKDGQQLSASTGVRLEKSEFLNDKGSDRLKGNHQRAKWVALTGLIDGQPVTVAVLSATENFRSPQAARLHPTKPYFCFTPCVDRSFTIDRDHPYKARYRFLISDRQPEPDWINRQWDTWMAAR